MLKLGKNNPETLPHGHQIPKAKLCEFILVLAKLKVGSSSRTCALTCVCPAMTERTTLKLLNNRRCVFITGRVTQ